MRFQPLVQLRAFDVAQWEVDAEFGVFPQGARAKDAVFAPTPPPEPVLVGGKRYLFKRSKRSYPDQFWGEVIAYRVGCLMGLHVPPAFAAFNSRTGHSGALIEWFYRDGAELFALGGDFMQMLRPDFDRDRGTQHNLQDVERLMRALVHTGALGQNWRQWWAEALLFDALIGNSDRHQDNWGLIFESIGRQPPHMPSCRLAPLFDNGTSLGHERYPDRVAGWTAARLDQYIERGTHHIKSSLDSHRIQGHLELLRHVLHDWAPHLDSELLRRHLDFAPDDLTECFADLGHLSMPLPLSAVRMQFVSRLLLRRLALLRDLLHVAATPPG
jgi:hypothetical protein